MSDRIQTLDNQLKNEQIEFLLEEPSMENFLLEILPSLLPDGYEVNVNCFLRPHQGKSDLQKSIPRKLKAFSNFYKPAKIIILHDQDSSDCRELKSKILQLCTDNGDCPVMVRIPCRELENWYLGDMEAIEKVYPTFKSRSHRYRAKYRNVDNVFGATELEKIIPTFQKGFASKNIPKHMNFNVNRSESFQQFISGLEKFLM